MIDRLSGPMKRTSGSNPFELRKAVQELNWNKVGVVRRGNQSCPQAAAEIETIAAEAANMRVEGGPRLQYDVHDGV